MVSGINVVKVVEETVGGGCLITVVVLIKVVGMEVVADRVIVSIDCTVTVTLGRDRVTCSITVE